MPISVKNFDIAFNKLGVLNFKTSYQCSCENYTVYNNLLNQVKELLTYEGINDVSLLNAHSFVWMIGTIEEDLKKLGVSETYDGRKISAYKELVEKDRDIVSKARVGQGIFRNKLIEYWGKCSVTGCDGLNILIASHIKPWLQCDVKEAIDVYNGLLLVPNLDKLFDLGMISFDDDGKILVSSKISTKNIDTLAINKEMKLEKIENGHKAYLAYHRKEVFEK
jgi:predicted restriction endonuclease